MYIRDLTHFRFGLNMIATHCTCMYEHPGPELQLGDRTVTSGFPASQFAGWTELHVDTQLVLVLRTVRMPPMTCWLLAFILSATVTNINGQCGNDTTNSSYLAPGARNVFFSPDYPDPYPSDVYCRWLLETNEGYRLRLRSTQFQLRTSNSSCVDIFRVYDGDSVLSPLLYSSCNESFQPINSSSRYLLVTFTSGISQTESEGGFLVIYESFKYIVTTTTSTTTVLPTREAVQCGANNLTAEAGVYGYITSPGFPNAYPNDATCTWSIMADNSSLRAVRLDIVRIDLEFSPNCSLDSITIYDVFSTRREEVRRFCSYLEEPVVSRGLYLLVMFTSDSAFSGRGFQLRYTSVARPTSTSTTSSTRSTSTLPTTTRPSAISVTSPSNDSECSSTPVSLSVSSGEVGYLQSPDYPYSSLNESECNWQISTDSNSVIKVTVQGLNLDLCSPCGDCDFLLIFDGRSVSNRSLGRVCNTYFQTVFYSTGPYLYLVMRTKLFSRGFSLRYEAVDVRRSPTPVTTLSTTTQQQSSSGTMPSSNGTVCSSSPVPLYVDIGQVRYLQSPNYPQNYFNNADCLWRIYTDNYLVVKVTVEEAHLEQCSLCGNCDSLEIFDGSLTLATKLGTVCGTSLQTVFYSSGPQLYLRLRTDSSVVSTGFRLRYEAVDERRSMTPAGTVSTSTISTSSLSKTTQQLFGGTTPSSNGTVCSSSPVPLYVYYGQVRYLQSPNYPQNYFNDADCQWRIYTDNIFYIKVTVEAANFEQCSACGNCDYLEIFDGSSTLATKLGTVCDTSLQTVFYSSGPQLYLRLRTDTSVVFTGFRLRYEVVTTTPSPSPLCSSTFSSLTSSYGRQKLLRFESYANQRSSQTCSWVIRSDDASHVVRFSFDYFNMQDCSNGNCDCGYLDIFDGMSESSPQLLRLCGTKVMPLGSVSTGNSLYLTFNSRGTWKPKTFALQYESVARVVQSQPLFPGVAPPTSNACSTHPVRLKAKDISDRLVLSSSSLPQSSSINSYCDWLITSDPGYVIQLITFTASSEYCTNLRLSTT
ncbi:cubilin-like isoform X1 [Pomacea canaliculata]|uniref:cubilin-like isoform X1 n=1 Tax=Pomacea canaliculata TaxID=400727 RepID=UPI000D72F6FC|nr:cubilin-like isoform X1 [Pomacea canaliculata]